MYRVRPLKHRVQLGVTPDSGGFPFSYVVDKKLKELKKRYSLLIQDRFITWEGAERALSNRVAPQDKYFMTIEEVI